MKLSTKFILFTVILHATAIGMSYFVFQQNKIYFLASELMILVSLGICWSLYNDMIRPLQLLMRGVDAIRDRDFNVKFLKTGRFEMDRLIEVYNNMIDQLRTERTLQEEQHFFLEKMVQTSPAGILMLDYDGNITGLNPKAADLIGIPEKQLIGQVAAQIPHPIFAAMSGLSNGESRLLTLPGARTYKIQQAQFVDRGFPRTFLIIGELTAEILEAEKRSYGKIIRMMAHEVNNSVGAVNSILDTTLQTQTGPSDLSDALRIAIDRNDHLNRFMRNFADVIRTPEPRPEAFDLNALVRNAARLMEYKAGEHGIAFQLELADTAVPILADRGLMEQVVINVVKNAIEACSPGGTVVFSTAPGRLVISDNGKGIPKDLEDKLFSPFFTNKNGGQGVGLTLTREILTAHGFGFSLKTGEDGWTRFEIVFKGTNI
jgi:nitrogen fixation/metabolism regulation signal transduction histidine kinase